MLNIIPVAEFLERAHEALLIDVRSEGEYEQGHISAAINLPLLNNDERKQVGICYKQNGKEQAVLLGFELVGNKFADYIRFVSKHTKEKRVYIYCWRGGMRSNIMAWLLSMAGFKVFLLKGGYKSYRAYILEDLKIDRNFLVLGGKTGSGKTEVLHALRDIGEQIIDLEGFASHRGSAYGNLGMAPQPSAEQFENDIFCALSKTIPSKKIWLENESRMIGTLKVPDPIYKQMRACKVLELDVNLEERIVRIVKDYGVFPKAQLKEITKGIEKRLGNLRMKQALEDLDNDNFSEWVKNLLQYYDRTYEYASSLRKPDSIIRVLVDSPMEIKLTAEKLRDLSNLI